MDYNLCEKSEQHQNDFTRNNSLHNQSLQSDSLLAVSQDPVLKIEHQQWDIKPDPWNFKADPYLQVKQDLTPDWSSEQSASTLNPLSYHDQQYQDDISIASSKEYNGL